MTTTRTVTRLRPTGSFAVAFSVAAAAAFLLVSPPVGDLWAARARESAVAHGVGLRYWFSWFGGTVPGHYSVLAPFLSKFVSVGVLGAVSTVAITPLVYLLVRGTAHPALATWLAAVGSASSLWSGRVPFAEGTAISLVALLCVVHDRRLLVVPLAVATALVSPLSAAFLALGLVGVVLHRPARRTVAIITVVTSGACLLGIALYFGSPGPQGFPALSVVCVAAALAALLRARPSAEVRTVLIIALVATPLLAVIPNGVGTNFERFAWICMPVATAATATAGRRVLLATTLFAAMFALIGSAKDLTVAASPISRTSYYAGLTAELDRLGGASGLADHRVEVVPDGTYVAAYALLGHASLARGYETQSDNELNAVLASPTLDAASYRTWLDSYAVSLVAIDRTTLKTGPENTLVRDHRPAYLTPLWSDAHWQLFAVAHPEPIVDAPARVTEADQSRLVLSTPQAGTLGVRLRWSSFLQAKGPDGVSALVAQDASGFTTLVVPRAGSYVITG